ncbi:hypothetical protein KCP71_24135 [Salmonella enterica subsp. enterica]|nr:hypothetical protein KCP71_24135 [Salmonella enterica subsp. enterica]
MSDAEQARSPAGGRCERKHEFAPDWPNQLLCYCCAICCAGAGAERKRLSLLCLLTVGKVNASSAWSSAFFVTTPPTYPFHCGCVTDGESKRALHILQQLRRLKAAKSKVILLRTPPSSESCRYW